MEKKKYYRFEPNDKGSFSIKEKMLFGAGKNCFKTKEEAIIHFKQAEKTALDKYEKIIIGINKLKESLGDFSYDYFMCGDTYGIYSDGIYIKFNVNGYDFKFPQ